MPELESRLDGIVVALKRADAQALADVAEAGLDAADAIGSVQSPVTADDAIAALRASRDSVTLTRPQATALATFAQRGFELAESARGRFRSVFDGVDLAAARRARDELTGAMR